MGFHIFMCSLLLPVVLGITEAVQDCPLALIQMRAAVDSIGEKSSWHRVEGTETQLPSEKHEVDCDLESGNVWKRYFSGNLVMLGDKGLWCPNAKIGTTTVYKYLASIKGWPADGDGSRRCYPAPEGGHAKPCWYEGEMRSAAEMVRRNHSQELCNAHTFTFIRNPWDRVRSAYTGKIETGKISVSNRTNMTFAEFVRFIGTQDPKEMNYHWRPVSQTCITTGWNRTFYDRVYKLEHGLNEQLGAAMQEIGWPLQEVEAANQKTDPSVDERRENFTSPTDLEYPMELADIVRRVYADDIRFGHYSFVSYA
mmetsp:Transcript_67657/g.147352  ORF Transcript_67657/g.147352 Transcript_67657/m.147352 type:complete len:310 (+) Transcript_67657:84-1013(+)